MGIGRLKKEIHLPHPVSITAKFQGFRINLDFGVIVRLSLENSLAKNRFCY